MAAFPSRVPAYVAEIGSPRGIAGSRDCRIDLVPNWWRKNRGVFGPLCLRDISQAARESNGYRNARIDALHTSAAYRTTIPACSRVALRNGIPATIKLSASGRRAFFNRNLARRRQFAK